MSLSKKILIDYRQALTWLSARTAPKLDIFLSLTLPLLVIVPHVNESFFGADFTYELNKFDNINSLTSIWDQAYLGGTSINIIKIHILILQAFSHLIGGFRYGPHLFIYICIAAYLLSFCYLLRALRNRIFGKNIIDYLIRAALVSFAFVSPVVLGYLANYFTVGILYYSSFAVAAIGLTISYSYDQSLWKLLLIVLSLSLVGHPPTFFFSTCIIFLFGILMGSFKIKELLTLTTSLLLCNIYWIWSLAFSLFDSGSISLSSDKSMVDHVFRWYADSVSVMNNALYSIYPNSRLWHSVPAYIYWVAFLGIYLLIFTVLLDSSSLKERFDRQKRRILFAASLILIVSFAFSLGPTRPFGNIFMLLWDNFSPIHLFKSFTQILNIAFPFFIMLTYMSLRLCRRQWLIKGAALLCAMTVIVVISYLPQLNRNIARGTIPEEYFQAKKLIDLNGDGARVLLVPDASYEVYAWNNGWDNYFIAQSLFKAPVVYSGTIAPTISKQLASASDYTDFIKNNGFKYVLSRKDVAKDYTTGQEKFDRSIFDIKLDNKYFTLYELKQNYTTNIVRSNVDAIQITGIDQKKTSLNNFRGISRLRNVLEKNQQKQNYIFTTEELKEVPNSQILSVYDHFDSTEINKKTHSYDGTIPSKLFEEETGGVVTAKLNNNSLYVYNTTSPAVRLDNSPASSRSLIFTGRVPISQNIYLTDSFRSVVKLQGEETRIGPIKHQNKLNVLKSTVNLIGNLNDTDWFTNISDCNSNKPSSKIIPYTEGRVSNNSYLKLDGANRTACTYTDIKFIEASEYILTFRYRTQIGKKIGYALELKNSDKPKIQGVVTSQKNNSWEEYTTKLKVPSGIPTGRLYLYAYDDTVDYSNIAFDSFEIVHTIDPLKDIRFTGVDVPKNKTKILVENESLLDKNIIGNGDFSNGLWSKRVGDCNNYDNKPNVNMFLKTKPSSNDSYLALTSGRHIACTWTDFKVDFQNDYLLNIDYISKQGYAGYNITFNDTDRTSIGNRFKTDSSKWTTYRDTFQAPPGATQAMLTLYAYGNEHSETSQILYDDISIRPIVNNSYFIFRENDSIGDETIISHKRISPTSLGIDLKTKNSQCIIVFAEQFHTGWGLKALPYNKSDLKPMSIDVKHFVVDGYANGWVIDAKKIKSILPSDYWHSDDDSLSLKLVADFAPQQTQQKAVVVSSVAFIGLGILLIVNQVKNSQNKTRRGRLMGANRL